MSRLSFAQRSVLRTIAARGGRVAVRDLSARSFRPIGALVRAGLVARVEGGLDEAARVVRPGGRILIVHYHTPRPPQGTRLVKVIGLSTGFNYPMRALSIYERDQKELSL